MKATAIFLCFIASTGCVQTQSVVMNDKVTAALINKRAVYSTIKITFKNGESRLVNSLNIESDSLSWQDDDGVNTQRAPTSSISEVAFVKKRSILKSGVGGVVLGAFGGGAVGYGWAVSMESSDSWGFEKEIYGYSGAIFGAGAGGLLGVLIAIPRGVIYAFEESEKAEKKGK